MELKENGHCVSQKFVATVDEQVITVDTSLLTGAELMYKAGFKHLQCHTLYQKFKGCDFEKVAMDEVIDLSLPGIEHFVTKGPDVFNYEVDNEPETTNKKMLTPHEVMRLKGVDPHSHYLVQLLDGGRIVYAFCPDEPIVMVCTGMRFVTEKWHALVNVEDYGKHCKPVPVARVYRIKVDKGYHDWPKPSITVAELIKLEYPHNNAPFDVYKFLNTSPKPVKLDPHEPVDLTEQCLVRFTIQPKEQKDGLLDMLSPKGGAALRREFSLQEEDVEFLDSLGLPWEAIGLYGARWLIISDFSVPEGYNVATVTVALLIAPSYPATEIDMAYFHPSLAKLSGRAISALSSQQIDGRNFQRWSRHRQPHEWRPGVDNVSTHLCLVNNWLVNDLNR